MRRIDFIETEEIENLRLRYIDERDLELLRIWKNENKKRFFFQKDISYREQAEWFSGFLERNDDYMFIVEFIEQLSSTRIGCLGFRMIDGDIDIYNVIRGKRIDNKFTMGDALKLMLNFICSEFPEKNIVCKVLTDNPAIAWYEKNLFSILEQRDNHFIMILNKHKIKPLKFNVR